MNAMTPPETLTLHRKAECELPVYDARSMMRDGVQARILLDDQSYFLRITRAGKLILTK